MVTIQPTQKNDRRFRQFECPDFYRDVSRTQYLKASRYNL